MSGTSEPIPNHPPSNPSKTVEVDGYRATFYPGFVRTLTVRTDDGKEIPLYDQARNPEDKVFYLPPGVTKPWPCSTVEFTRPGGMRVLLQINADYQQVDRIEVRLNAGNTSGARIKTGLVDAGLSLGEGEDPPPPAPPCVLVIEDGPVLCPPACPET